MPSVLTLTAILLKEEGKLKISNSRLGLLERGFVRAFTVLLYVVQQRNHE